MTDRDRQTNCQTPVATNSSHQNSTHTAWSPENYKVNQDSNKHWHKLQIWEKHDKHFLH